MSTIDADETLRRCRAELADLRDHFEENLVRGVAQATREKDAEIGRLKARLQQERHGFLWAEEKRTKAADEKLRKVAHERDAARLALVEACAERDRARRERDALREERSEIAEERNEALAKADELLDITEEAVVRLETLVSMGACADRSGIEALRGRIEMVRGG